MNGSGGGGGGNNSGGASKYQGEVDPFATPPRRFHVPPFDFGGYLDANPQSNGLATPLGYTDWSEIFALSWHYKVPELRTFIDGWIKKLQDPDYVMDPYLAEDLFEAELKQQSWFTTNSEAWITAEQERLSNEITWKENLKTHSSDIRTIASDMGYTISEDEADTIADISIHAGYWTKAEIERYILDSRYYDRPSSERDLPAFGSVRGEADYLNQIADDNLVDISGRVNGWAHDIKSERMTREQAEQQIFQLARSGRFSFLGEDRWDQWQNSGMTVRSFANPLRETLAGVWELDTNEVPLNHAFFDDNLVRVGDDGKERFITSREVKELAMKSPEYKKTAAYRRRMADFKYGIYKSWGAI
tara:strand:+ start:557 stop:1636 length:1080 start_codon:yes stop_codon:yes gene_type:complete